MDWSEETVEVSLSLVISCSVQYGAVLHPTAQNFDIFGSKIAKMIE